MSISRMPCPKMFGHICCHGNLQYAAINRKKTKTLPIPFEYMTITIGFFVSCQFLCQRRLRSRSPRLRTQNTRLRLTEVTPPQTVRPCPGLCPYHSPLCKGRAILHAKLVQTGPDVPKYGRRPSPLSFRCFFEASKNFKFRGNCFFGLFMPTGHYSR